MTDTLSSPGPLQFGRPAAAEPRDRTAAFGVAERGGRVAVVHVTRPEGSYFDLPGGGVDPGEDEAQALVREFGEETGLVIRAGRLLGRAAQFSVVEDGEAVNNASALFAVEITGEEPDLKIEADHELRWLEPLEALAQLRHDSHAWAVALWLRTHAGR